MKTVISIIKWILILAIFLFSVATLMGGSYFQTATLWIMIAAIVWWPYKLTEDLGFRASFMIRSAIIILLFLTNIFFFKPDPKESIYLSELGKQKVYSIYDQKVKDWPDDVQDIWLNTEYGKVHVLATGDTSSPPVLLFHAASMGAHSWAENLDALKGYRVYAIDNIGEGNKSELKDPLIFPENGQDLAELYKNISDMLGVNKSPVIGASNGGFIALNYAYYHPEKVDKLVLLGPMGLTPLSSTSIMMMSLPVMYPFPFINDYVTSWAIGDDFYVNEKYGDWFECILQSTIPSLAGPVPLTQKQIENFKTPVLLILGTKDALVGEVKIAETAANNYSNIKIVVLDSGHLVGVEEKDTVNKEIRKFLK